MKVRVFPHATDVGRSAASVIADGIRQARRSGRDYLLGCPAGRSARTTYRSLAQLLSVEQIPLDHLRLVLMDSYVHTVGKSLCLPPGDAHWSAERFAAEEIVGPLNAAAPAGKGVAAHHVWLPDPSEPEEFDQRIRSAGGVDLFLLASGSTDGHVGFNPPGTDRGSVTRVVELAESTRRDNLATYPGFASFDDVPRHGVTVGISTIVENSRSAIMITLGREKQTAFRRMSTAAAFDPVWPASIVRECRQASLLADRAAAPSFQDRRAETQNP
ncbi:6-phosphogluconolactonase [Streptomyces sp. BV129]|uniref:6-phosphogluconolactonase n=1 Tax=Streptomyces sp. BV129 TaxID=2849671 RepID=UPI0020C5B680|nr:hypothetical protein [Streptomyces sp. BV129]